MVLWVLTATMDRYIRLFESSPCSPRILEAARQHRSTTDKQECPPLAGFFISSRLRSPPPRMRGGTQRHAAFATHLP